MGLQVPEPIMSMRAFFLKVVRLFVKAISSLSGFDGFQTGTTRTNEFCLVFYEVFRYNKDVHITIGLFPMTF